MKKRLAPSTKCLRCFLYVTLFFSSATYVTNCSAAFVGQFDLMNWTFSNGRPSDNGHVDLSLAPDTFTLIGSNSGSGRGSQSTFSLDLSSLQFLNGSSLTYTIDTSVFGQPNPIPFSGGFLVAVTNYTAEIHQIQLDYDWNYVTNDLDGPAEDSLVCFPDCAGFSTARGSNQSGHVTAILASSVGLRAGTSILNPNNPLDTRVYDVYVPMLGTPPSEVFAKIVTSDNNFGSASVSWTNFSATFTSQTVSGTIYSTVPVPSAAVLLLSSLGFLPTFGLRRS